MNIFNEEFINNQEPLDDRVRRIHFVGIGGAGMSGIAEVLLNQGYQISGSDLSENNVTQRLHNLGATIFQGHSAENIAGADVVVFSTAITETNPEIIAAREARLPIIPRAQMLAELMRNRYGIAVAGTHGKTTTTSLVTSLLAEGGLDPTFIIGGLLNSAGCNARLGASQYLVAEADESDASFLFLKPKMTIVTNIDADHMWDYDNNFDRLRQTFIEFLHHLPLAGLAILCIDDVNIREILPQVARPMITYGFADDADIQISDFQQKGLQSHFKILVKSSGMVYPIKANLLGRHNALNTASAIAVAHELGVSAAAITRALENFQGIGRRLQILGNYNFAAGKALVIDDYGHHPREVAATLEAVRLVWPEKRLVLAFQPHRYTRTMSLFEDFTNVLSKVDKLLLLEIYPAGEKPIPNVESKKLCRAIRERGQVEPIYLGRDDNINEVLDAVLKDDDILLLQGAGDIGTIAANLPVTKTDIHL